MVIPKNLGSKWEETFSQNKKTYLLIRAFETAQGDQLTELTNWVNKSNPDPQEKVQAVTQLYTELGIREETEAKINAYFDQAFEAVELLAIEPDKKSALRKFMAGLVDREV